MAPMLVRMLVCIIFVVLDGANRAGGRSVHHVRRASSTLGPLIIRALEIFLGYASPCLIDLFTPKI
jgi:hypothetical protein